MTETRASVASLYYSGIFLQCLIHNLRLPVNIKETKNKGKGIDTVSLLTTDQK